MERHAADARRGVEALLRTALRQKRRSSAAASRRGCRLALLFPEIYEMQVRAIVAAAVAVRERQGDAPRLEVTIPLVGYERELSAMRVLVERTAAEAIARLGAEPLPFAVGTMIELPRACLVAERLAADASFFSFGTNDLTQTALAAP